MTNKATLSLVVVLSYCMIIQAFDKQKCLLNDRWPAKQAIPPTESCPSDVLDTFPSADAFAMILDQEGLRDQFRVRRFKKKEGKPGSNTCYQRDEAIQFVVGTYNKKETVVIYFYGTENDFDMETDLEIEHIIAYLPDILTSEIKQEAIGTDLILKSKFRVHKGVYDNIISHRFTNVLREKLLGIYYKHLDENKNYKPKKLVIGGRSLGAAYAIMFYLELVGNHRGWRQRPGFHYLPTELDDITVIPICSPMIVHHGDIDKISEDVQSRIYNIITYRDPVVIMLSGKENAYKKELDYNLKTVLKHLSDKKLMKLGTNGPVGNFIMFMRSNTKKKYKNKIVVKVLDRNEVYLTDGAKCLWKNTKMGLLAMKKLWPKYHRKQPYLDHIMNSCIKKYLQSSKYWKEREHRRRIAKKAHDEGKMVFFVNGKPMFVDL